MHIIVMLRAYMSWAVANQNAQEPCSIRSGLEMALEFPAHTAEALPLDVLPLILEHLSDRKDLCTCALLSKDFHNAATPLLYRTLDVRVVTHRKRPVSKHII